MSPRQLAKTVWYRARQARARALAAPRGLPWLRRRLRLPSNDRFDPLQSAAADVRVTRLDPPGSFLRPLPDFPVNEPAARAFFAARAREANGPAYVAEFAGGRAWGHPTGGVFTADGRFAPAFTHDPCGDDFHTVWMRLRLPRPRALRGKVLYLVTPEAADNYHHWMIDLLPRLGLVRRAGHRLRDFTHVIVNHRRRPYQLATLEHCGLDPDRIIAADASLHITADLLVVPSLKPDNQNLPPADLAFLREVFPAAAAGTRRRRLFLSRRDAAFRRLANEDAFRPLLEAHGFEIVTLAGLAPGAQARLFASAEVIAGPSGAAFANLAFAEPGTRVIEIAPPQWPAVYHWMISARLGLSHGIVFGDGAVATGLPDNAGRRRDLVLAPRRLAAALAATVRPAPPPAAGAAQSFVFP